MYLKRQPSDVFFFCRSSGALLRAPVSFNALGSARTEPDAGDVEAESVANKKKREKIRENRGEKEAEWQLSQEALADACRRHGCTE